jgi:predicted dehydrogenase
MNEGTGVKEPIRWGILGCGTVTEVKSGPAFQKVPGSELVAVMRRDGEKARDYARRHGVPRWYDDADDLLHDPGVDAVYIATPPGSHAEYTVRAARAGKPVYVEKPMGRTYAECQAMIEACEAAGVPLFVAYYRRALPAFLKIKELVEAGAVGAVRFVTITIHRPPRPEDRRAESLPWRVIPELAGGGYFFDLASHQLDYLDYLLGPIVYATGVAANQAGLYPAEDVVAASLAFESGAVTTGVWSFAAWDDAEGAAIVGSEGRIEFSFFEPEPVRLHTAAGIEVLDLPTPQHVQQPLIQTVVDELLGRGRCPSTGRSAARTNWALDQIVAGWRARETE